MNFWQKLFSRKASDARIAMSLNLAGSPQTPPANYETYAKQGYQKSVTAYRCVDMIADACKGIPWLLYQGKGQRKREIEQHDLLTLLERPNPLQGQGAFVESVISFFILDGNSYIEAVGPRPGAPPKELYAVRPDRMKVVPGKLGFPEAYIYKVGGVEKRYMVDVIKGKSQILHMKTFHPTNDWYGMSPLEAAILNLDQNNAVNTWNNALLKNMATPSGVLEVVVNDANPTGTLTTEQFNRLKAQIYEDFMGARNAGRPMLLEGGMKWNQISLSPKDMDFINNKQTSARDIALAFGVPPMLLGIPGDNTYANYKEARQAFYEDTVLPVMDFFKGELNNWLTPAYGDKLTLDFDVDDIPALAPKREAKFTSIQNANWLTINEKREATGYGPKQGWDVIVVGSSPYNIDEPFETDEPTSEEDQPNDNGTPNQQNDQAEPSATPSPNEDDQVEETEGADSLEAAGLDQPNEIKAVNLITANDKRKSWKHQNRRRQHLENNCYADLKEDFADVVKAIESAAKSASTMQTLEFAVLKAIDDEFARMEKTLQKHIKRGIDDFGDMIFSGAKSLGVVAIEKKANTNFESAAVGYAKRRAGEAISQIKGTTQKQVRKNVRDLTVRAIEEGLTMTEVANELTTKFTDLSPGRARTIARTEMTTATQTGSLEAAKSLEIPDLTKEWVSAQDDRVRGLGESAVEPDHAVMNGQTELLDAKFVVPPDADMEGPGDPAGGASQVCNCRCVLVYKRGKVE